MTVVTFSLWNPSRTARVYAVRDNFIFFTVIPSLLSLRLLNNKACLLKNKACLLKNKTCLLKNTRRFQLRFVSMSLSGRSEVIFDPKGSHFTTVPKSVYRGKVTWERAVDDLGTSCRWLRNGWKLTLGSSSLKIRFFGSLRRILPAQLP